MARITIEDCMEQVPNRFHLVRMASIRAKQLKKGARPLLTSENKEVVTSLREIAAGVVKPGDAEVLPEEAGAYEAGGEVSFEAAATAAEEAAPAEAGSEAESTPEVTPEG